MAIDKREIPRPQLRPPMTGQPLSDSRRKPLHSTRPGSDTAGDGDEWWMWMDECEWINMNISENQYMNMNISEYEYECEWINMNILLYHIILYYIELYWLLIKAFSLCSLMFCGKLYDKFPGLCSLCSLMFCGKLSNLALGYALYTVWCFVGNYLINPLMPFLQSDVLWKLI